RYERSVAMFRVAIVSLFAITCLRVFSSRRRASRSTLYRFIRIRSKFARIQHIFASHTIIFDLPPTLQACLHVIVIPIASQLISIPRYQCTQTNEHRTDSFMVDRSLFLCSPPDVCLESGSPILSIRSPDSWFPASAPTLVSMVHTRQRNDR